MCWRSGFNECMTFPSSDLIVMCAVARIAILSEAVDIAQDEGISLPPLYIALETTAVLLWIVQDFQ